MPSYDYPLELSFKVATIHTRVRILDAAGREAAYVRKKALKLKEDATVYEDEGETGVRFRIAADRVLDFNASYAIQDSAGRPLGSVAREGARSLWKSSYKILDPNRQEVGRIQEENPWTRVLDGLFEIIPFADMPSTEAPCCGSRSSGRFSRAGSASKSAARSPGRRKTSCWRASS